MVAVSSIHETRQNQFLKRNKWVICLFAVRLLVTYPLFGYFDSGPSMVAWLGGSHTDSRFRRGMGGVLHPEYDVRIVREILYRASNILILLLNSFI